MAAFLAFLLTDTERLFSVVNMSSEPASDASPDLTARARIRDAAITRFAADGVSAASVRAIAADAGVSPALVIHHFGSKDALRVACDQHVAETIRDTKRSAVAAGPSLDPVAALRANQHGAPLLRYLARTLVDTSPHVAELVDELVEDAVEYMEEGVATGLLEPSDDPRGRAVVLTMWTLGALVLHEHVVRIRGVDLTGDPAEFGPWAVPAAEILAKGVINEDLFDRIRDGYRPPDGKDDR